VNWKVVIVVVLLGIAAFFGYQNWQSAAQDRAALCEHLRECMLPGAFAREFGNVDRCAESEAGERAAEAFAACDPHDDCITWLDCGYGEGSSGTERDTAHKTHFQEVLPHIE
jgi:hypothetical protein